MKSRRLVVLWLLSTASLLPALFALPGQSAGDDRRAGNLVEARIKVEKALQQEPDNAEANLESGLLLGSQGNVQAASQAFRKAIAKRPDWAEAHYNLGLTMIADPTGKRDWPGALREFREALRLRPGYAAARRLVGTGLLELGQREEAITELKQALAAEENSPEIHLDLGRALEGAGQRAAAEQEFRSALRLRPSFVDAEIALGKLLSGTAESIAHLKRALSINPDNAAAQYALAKALQSAGEATEAAIAFRQAATVTKRQEEAVQCTRLSNEGLDSAHQGQLETAIRLIKEAVGLRPDSALAHFNLGLVLADRKDITASLSQVVEAISLMPLDARFYITLARIAKRGGDLQRARRAFERAVELDPENSEAVSNLRELDRSGIHSAPDGDPYAFGAPRNTPDSHFAFATLLAKQGDWIGSCGEWLRVLALQPDNVDARNNLAIAYAKLGKDERAELEFRKSLQVSKDAAGAHYGLAVLDLERGNKPQAAQELREVLRIHPDDSKAKSLFLEASR